MSNGHISAIAIALMCCLTFLMQSECYAKKELDHVAVANALKAWQAQFSSIHGYSCSTERVFKTNKLILKNAETDREFRGKMFFKVFNDWFYYRNAASARNRKRQTSHFIYAFNGEYVQRLDYDTGELYIKQEKESQVDLSMLKPFNDFFLAFEYFPEIVENPWRVVTLSDLKDENHFNAFKKQITRTADEFDGGRDCFIIWLAGGTEPSTGASIEYKVYLSKEENYYPIFWQMVEKDSGLPVFEFRVQELAKYSEGESRVFYPKKASRIFFGANSGDYPRIEGEWRSRVEILYEHVEINKDIDQQEFTIDISLASRILDADNHVIIRVPK